MLVAFPLWALPHNATQAAVDDAEFTRLSGPSRYSTAVQIAEAYMDHIDDLPGESRVDTVIMGPGLDEHFGWVAPVPMLSRLERAPLVFTRPDEVPVPVAQFLQRRAVRKVILLGGTSVISADVEDELVDLGIEEVERLGSDDIHLHAVAVAESFDHPAGEFKKKGRTALLATSNAFADALAAGPMAYQGEYPILLTPPGQLHPAVFDYLVASDIEHLIILGGTAAVGTAVQQQLSGLDFTIARIAGADRYATAVRLAEAQLADEGLRPCFDGAELGLAFGGLSPDAIASGPLLGELCAPLLLTPSDALPRSVALFLRSDDYVTGDADNDLEVTVFGGAAVVPTDVVTQFFERATTLVPIGGRIAVVLDLDTETTNEFTVSFDSEVDAKKAATAVELEMFRVNYERVFPVPKAEDATHRSGPRSAVRLRSGPAGQSDRPAVRGTRNRRPHHGHRRSAHRPQQQPPPRRSLLLRHPRARQADRPRRPRRRDHRAGRPQPDSALGHRGQPARPRRAFCGGAGRPRHFRACRRDREGSQRRVWPSRRGFRHESQAPAVPAQLDPTTTLDPGDAITVPRGAFLDEDGRRNPLHRYVVPEPSIDFRIESVTIGNVESGNRASVELDAGTQLNMLPANADSLTITARRDGIAAGSRGNDWRIYGVGLPETDEDDSEDTDPVDCSDPDENCVAVSLNRTSRLIRYDILEGEPTFADLAEALAADSDFAANFTVSISGVTADSGSIGGTVAAGRQFSGGGTAVGVRVRFSDAVKALLDALQDGANEREPVVPGVTDCTALPLLNDIVPSFDAAKEDGCTLSFVAPDNIVHLSSTPQARHASRAGRLGVHQRQRRLALRRRNNIAQGWLSIRYDPDVPVVD